MENIVYCFSVHPIINIIYPFLCADDFESICLVCTKSEWKTVANIHGNMSERLHKHNDMHYNLLVWLNPFEHIVSTWTLSNKLLKFIAHWTYTIDHHNTKIQCITASIHRIRMQVNKDTSIHTIHIAVLLRKPKWQRKTYEKLWNVHFYHTDALASPIHPPFNCNQPYSDRTNEQANKHVSHGTEKAVSLNLT